MATHSPVEPVQRSAPPPDRRCAYCERLRDDLITYTDGAEVCLDCRQREQERYAAATGGQCTRCPYHMAWHRGGRCPTEAEARAQSGAQ